MEETCCVTGCVVAKEDISFFKFPSSRSLRLKWLDTVKPAQKVTQHTAVCSQHFLPEQYEVVRGKRRLKAKVVPSIFDIITKPKSPQNEPNTKERIEETRENEPEDRDNTNVTTDNNATIEQNQHSPDQRLEMNTIEHESRSKNAETEEDLVERTQPDNTSMDSESNKDIEDIITNYQIKQTRPVHAGIHADTRTDTTIEIEVPAATDSMQIEDEVIEVYGDETEPVFIEVSIGKGGEVSEASNQDCLMLLESVQCEVDPSCLVFPEPDPDPDPDPGNDSDVVDLGERKEDPVSLLTSSDEDEVIIEEPKYDMIEVSDETDEDDVPLVKLVDKPKPKPVRSKKTKAFKPKPCKSPVSGDTITKILWGQLYEYFCMECHYKSTSRAEYKKHLQEHSTVIQVCELCSYTTSSKHQYIRHKRKHRDDKIYKCHLCKYKARHNMSLIYHMKSHGGDVAALRCGKCDYVTGAKSELAEHARTCAGAPCKRFVCRLCEYGTDRRSDMRRHKARRHQLAGLDGDDDDDYVPPDWIGNE